MASATRPDPAATAVDDLLDQQLRRMRGMLFGYSRLFFTHVRVYALVVIALLVASLWQPLGGAVLIVPFLVPFVFLEASYLFWYTVFARRHAEWLERALMARLGSGVPAVHRLEAAYFYEPDSPTIAALDLRRPASHMSAATLGYSAMAGFAWIAAMILGMDWIGAQAEHDPLLGWVPVIAVLWTLAVVAYLLVTWLRRADEGRLVAALERVYADDIERAQVPPQDASSEEAGG